MGTTRTYYRLGDDVMAQRERPGGMGDGTPFWLHADHLGGASLTTNASGAKQNSQEYGPWGNLRAGDLPETTLDFTGQRRDDTGLLYYGARYYDPVLGRFLSADPIGVSKGDPQTLNRYSYVLNNPVNRTDPTGNQVQYPGGLYQPPPTPSGGYFGGGYGGCGPMNTYTLCPGTPMPTQPPFRTATPAPPTATATAGGCGIVGPGNYTCPSPTATMAPATATATMLPYYTNMGGMATPGAMGTPPMGGPPTNRYGQPYPTIVDPLTGQPIPYPGNIPPRPLLPNDRGDRPSYDYKLAYEGWYAEQYRAKYGQELPGGIEQFFKGRRLHHILPIEYGGGNGYENLVPVTREDHETLNKWWIRYPR